MSKPPRSAKPKDHAAQPSLPDPDAAGENPAQNDNSVGRCRPPRHSRYKPGQSGNPGGRPKGRLNNRTILARVLGTRITMRVGETDREVSLLEANYLAHALNGAKANVHSTLLLLKCAEKEGLVCNPGEAAADNSCRGNQPSGASPSWPIRRFRAMGYSRTSTTICWTAKKRLNCRA